MFQSIIELYAYQKVILTTDAVFLGEREQIKRKGYKINFMLNSVLMGEKVEYFVIYKRMCLPMILRITKDFEM